MHIGASVIEQADNIAVAHLYAAMRAGRTHYILIGTAMNVDITAHGVHVSQSVLADFQPTQPQNARQYPVALRKLLAQRRCVYLAGRTTTDEHGIHQAALPYPGANNMPAARRAFAVGDFARAILRGTDRNSERRTRATQTQALFGNTDFYYHEIIVHGSYSGAVYDTCHPSGTHIQQRSTMNNRIQIDPQAEARMSAYIKRIATGPKMSKDLSLEEARDGMTLILTDSVDPVQAAIFLIALRMKRESDDENRGVLEALRDTTQFAVALVDDLIDIADPYDGFLRHLPAGPFLPALLAACGVPAVSHGCRELGPKFGWTHHQVLAAAGITTDLTPEAAAICVSDPRIGWAYVDQHRFHPGLHRLIELRRLMVKRPCLSTLEKFCGPIRARGNTHLMVGYVHTAYEELLPLMARHAGFSSAMIVRGIEGGVIPPLNTPSKSIRYTSIESTALNRLAPREAGIETEIRNTPLPTDAESPLPSAIADATAQVGLQALQGKFGPMRDSLVLSAASVLHHLGRAESLLEGATLAANALDSGAAYARFQAFPRVLDAE